MSDITLEPQRLMGERFTLLKELGKGAFGEALLVIDKTTRRHMVVKRILSSKSSRAKNDLQMSLTEIQNIRSIHHPNIVAFHMAWVEAADNQLHMLFEYCDGGDLEEFLQKSFPVPEATIIQIIAQLLIALDHLHIKHFIHRDIKLANVLLCRTPMIVKIADFGLSKSLPETDARTHTLLGTPLYFSPEIAAGQEYSRGTDIWSLGVLCYQLITNQLPFSGRTMAEVLERIKHHNPQNPCVLAPQYQPEIGRIVMRMLTKSRSARPTARELLSSPIFKESLRKWPWNPAWRNSRCMFVNRSNCCVNVRSQPTTRSDILTTLDYGDQILVRDEVVPSDGSTVVWYHVIYPVADGYCVSTDGGKNLFQRVDDAARASPLTTAQTPPRSPLAPSRSPSRRTVSPLMKREPSARSPLRAPTPTKPSPLPPTTSPLRRVLSLIRAQFGVGAGAGGGGGPLRPITPVIAQPTSPIRQRAVAAAPMAPLSPMRCQSPLARQRLGLPQGPFPRRVDGG